MPKVNLRKLHDIQLRQGFMDTEVAGLMRVDKITVKRMCGRDSSRVRGKSYRRVFENYLAFCEAIKVDPVTTFAEILEDD